MDVSDTVRTLERDLRAIFGDRLRSLVAYRNAGDANDALTPTLAVVDGLTVDDLRGCADRVLQWHESGLATPLLLRPEEFGRSLDAFPYEFGAILADHTVVAGENPFKGLRVNPADLRRACEIQVRSHLLHLREGYMEAGGRSDAVAELVTRSLPPLIALLKSMARLQGTHDADALTAAALVEKAIGVSSESTATLSDLVMLAAKGPLSPETARRLFPGYVDTLERLTVYVDRWTA